ncbi:hypothetical protein N9W89_12170 [Hellea sp.]|nr:hypothetical protein [Hellea sp.]
MSNDNEGISFYFFDLDDNTFFLETKIFIKNMKTGDVISVSTHEFAQMRNKMGNTEPWTDYSLYEDSYKNFRDRNEDGEKEYLVEDIEHAMGEPIEKWQGPAFKLFQHACEQQRPLGIVTARGHSRETIKAGIQVMVDAGFLSQSPNYLGVYAVSNEDMRKELKDSTSEEQRQVIETHPDPTSQLKRVAINNLVEQALETYGSEAEHRFGMSDDDPKNVDLIIKAMCECKIRHPEKRFFVINTHKGEHVKLEVFPIDFPVTKNASADEISGWKKGEK